MNKHHHPLTSLTPYFLCALLAAVTLSCASTPRADPSIEDARATIQRVERLPLAGEVAKDEISAAHAQLHEAEDLLRNKKSKERVANAAYLAKRHAQIAEEQVATAQAKKLLETAAEERQAVIIESRERETAIARESAEIKTREAEAKSREVEQKEQQVVAANREIEALQRELSDLNARQTERGLVLTLGDVLFDTGQATLKPGAFSSLDRLATFLKESPDRKVLIEGHTDSVGSEQMNQALSERRAASVREALANRGVSGDRITAEGKGEGYPVAGNDSPSGRQQNRRVEIVIDETRQRL